MVTVGIALALGGRASAALVRSGADAARVEARFEAPDVPELREWAEDGEIVLGRAVSVEGKSTARVAGQLAPVSALGRLAPTLVEVHGQNQTQRLLSPSTQIAFLDRLAATDHATAVAAYREAYERLRTARARLHELSNLAREREREIDLLDYQVREIEAAAVVPGELGELVAGEARLAHAEHLLELSEAAEAALSNDGRAADDIRTASAALADAGELDPAAAELASRAVDLAEEAADLSRGIRGYRERILIDPAQLEDVRDRIHAIRGLERKYGEGEVGILVFLGESRARLHDLSGADAERRGLEAEVERLGTEAAELAARLTAGRIEAAPRLSVALEEELHELGMEGAAVDVRLSPVSTLGPDGAEGVELLFSGGVGQPSLPLAKMASGGELSRAMLACRSVLADLDHVPTLVFDEVDAGIGGRAGIAVGKRLAALAADRQVLVVTHLPQIASFADRHIRVEKAGGTAAVTILSGEDRVEELSRMLAGLPGSERAAAHAEELLAEAGEAKTVR